MSDSEWATGEVSLWVTNDGDFYGMARALARTGREDGDYAELERYLTRVQGVRANLTDEDLELVDWAEVADDLLGE